MNGQISTRKAQLSAAKQALLAKRLQGKGAPQPPTIPRRDPTTPVPLSFSQQRLWFLYQFEPENPFYNVPFALKIQGKLDVSALEKVFQALVKRHEILRTTIADEAGDARQIVHPQGAVVLRRISLSALPNSLWDEVERLAGHEAGRPFDLRQGPLLRVTLLTLATDEFVLLVTLHHIVSDVWSTGILVRELVTLYQAFTQAKPDPLPALPIQYADFTLWQRQLLQGEHLQTQLQYWQQQFATLPPVLQLPTDRPRPVIQRFCGESRSFKLAPALTKALKNLSQKTETTLFMVLLAAFKVLLYRYTGQTDITVGSPIANRNRAAIEGLIGLFMNTLALRTELGGDPSFLELLSRVRQVALGAYSHQDLPFEKLIEVLQIPRDLSHTPLFQAVFILQNAPTSALNLPGLRLTPLGFSGKTAKFDLTLVMTEVDGGLEGGVEYNTDLFDGTTIDRLIGHFQTLLTGIVAQPDASISQIPWLTPAEWTQLHQWNQTTVQFASPPCVHQLFEAQVAKTPEAIAVACESHTLTYAELNHRADCLARYLQGLGVGPEVLVGICLARSLEMITALLGVLKAGGAYVPLDPSYPQQRLAFMVEDANLTILLTQSSLLEGLPDYSGRILCLDRPLPAPDPGQLSSKPQGVSLQPENLAYMIYTSGSTGNPKGVQIAHRALVNFLKAQSQLLKIASQDVLLAVTSLSFDIAELELFLPLTVGAQVVIATLETASDGFHLADQLETVGATFMQATPSTWRMLLLANWTGNAGLKILCGGEALPPDLATALQSRAAALWNLYGPTETTIWSAQRALEETDSIGVGTPIANTDIYLLDQHLNPVPVGVPGELYIGGLGLARGYFQRPSLTAERFVPHPFSEALGARLYRTGDLARHCTDGTIEVLGRLDHQAKIRGFRIELGEIESVLSRHEQVREVVVMVREDNPDQKRLTAYLTPQASENAEAAAVPTATLRQWLQRQLPGYMVPALFVWLERLPLTPNGKIDRRSLPVPDLSAGESKPCFAAPRSPLEQQLAAIWSQVLGTSTVGIDDNFFELGGDSILGLQMVANAQQAGLHFTPKHLFQHQTIRTLAQVVDEAYDHEVELGSDLPLADFDPDAIARLVNSPSPPVDAYPLSPSQQGMLFHTLYSPEDGLYLNQICCRLEGVLDLKALQQTWQRVCDRHVILRTAFVWEELLQPLQVVLDHVTVPWFQHDWRTYSPAEQARELSALLQRDRASGFQLAKAPLMRLTVIQLTDNSYEVLWSFHHLILDGWSLPIIFREVFAFYEGFRQSTLPHFKTPRPYRDYIAWLAAQESTAAEAFWTSLLQGFHTPTSLGHTRSSHRTPDHTRQSKSLSSTTTVALQALAQKSHLTLNTLVQGAWAQLLSHISGDTDVVFGATAAGRPPDLIGANIMVGLFINSLPVRVRLSHEVSIVEWLQALQLQQSQAREYESTALSQIHRWSDVPTDKPLFESLVVFENYPVEVALDTLQVSLKVQSVQSYINNNYPLTVRALPGSELVLQLMSDRTCFSAETTDRWLQNLAALLQWLVDHPEKTVGQWQSFLVTLDQEWHQRQAQLSTQANLQKLRNIRRKTILSDSQEETS